MYANQVIATKENKHLNLVQHHQVMVVSVQRSAISPKEARPLRLCPVNVLQVSMRPRIVLSPKMMAVQNALV